MQSSPPEPALSIDEALARARKYAATGERRMLGICGPPGGGKSTLAERIVDDIGDRARLVRMDGFHLAQVELARLGREDRKGAIDTFDAAGYVNTLRRLRDAADDVVYAPEFRRDIEEPIAGAVAVPRDVTLVVTEGNYLLVDKGPWRAVAGLLDEVWFVTIAEETRVRWLIERHIRYGRSPDVARAWALGSDRQNAQLVHATKTRADAFIRVDVQSRPRNTMCATTTNQPLASLTSAGTSVWLDQLSRGLIESGELKRMVEQESLRGVTSNPAIFEKAILGSPDYDDDLRRLSDQGKSAREIYRAMALHDVRAAADALRPVYDATNGLDGYVSWEVAPRLAHDTEGTLEQAHMYWELVDRPNLMIKIPATAAGLPAIEQALYDGLNVNVTLLFSVAQYELVMEAYIRAQERRLSAGRPLDRHSVASFFVSRVDTEVDKRLEALGNTELQGRAGLANARAAYHAFQRVFGGERFAALREAGAPVQRPLWASTGVKNPAYPSTLYVYGLVGPDTVNTMPLPVLQAAGRNGEVTGPTAAEDPTPDLEALRAAGIDLDDVTQQLLREGVDAFMVPMKKLLDGIETRRRALIGPEHE